MASPTAQPIADLNAYDLRYLAQELRDHTLAISTHLGETEEHVRATVDHLLQLAELKLKHDAAELAKCEAWLAAKAAWEAEVEAKVQSVIDVLSRVGTRRSQAEKLVAAFDITPKG